MDAHDIFSEKSTHQHDYTVPKLLEVKKVHQWTRDPKTPQKILRQKPYQPKDIHTMRPWKDPYKKAPFDLLWQTKDIVRTHPQSKFGICPKPDDPLKESVMKTRPRLKQAPALSMDDITDKDVRELLVEFTYSTTFEHVTKEMNLKVTQREVPRCCFEKSVDPVRGHFDTFRPIPLPCRKIGKAWETHQYTTLADPHRQFWLNYKNTLNLPVGRDQFEHTVPAETRKEIRELIAKDDLRMPYDKMKPNYAGHVPRNVIGPFSRQEYENKIKN